MPSSVHDLASSLVDESVVHVSPPLAPSLLVTPAPSGQRKRTTRLQEDTSSASQRLSKRLQEAARPTIRLAEHLPDPSEPPSPPPPTGAPGPWHGPLRIATWNTRALFAVSGARRDRKMRALSFLPPSLLIELPTADSALDTVLVEGKPKAGYEKSE